jgi:hypothetical protein
MPTSTVERTSYRFGCGNVSRSVDRIRVYLRYALTFLFSLCIIDTNCVLLIIWNFFQRYPFDDAESRPTLAYRWQNITNVTCTLTGHYMTYTNVFECITATEVLKPLFACHLFSNTNIC